MHISARKKEYRVEKVLFDRSFSMHSISRCNSVTYEMPVEWCMKCKALKRKSVHHQKLYICTSIHRTYMEIVNFSSRYVIDFGVIWDGRADNAHLKTVWSAQKHNNELSNEIRFFGMEKTSYRYYWKWNMQMILNPQSVREHELQFSPSIIIIF